MAIQALKFSIKNTKKNMNGPKYYKHIKLLSLYELEIKLSPTRICI